MPRTLVNLPAVHECNYALAVTQAIGPLSLVGIAVSPKDCALTMRFAINEVALVDVAVSPNECAFTGAFVL